MSTFIQVPKYNKEDTQVDPNMISKAIPEDISTMK